MATQFLLGKLRELARAMDARRIEALVASWHTNDWPSYIRRNEVLAEVRPTPGYREVLAESTPGAASTDVAYEDAWA